MTVKAARAWHKGGEARKDEGRRVLYLSYDGMTDPLGPSQVLPYLFGLARLGHDITLISFEKRKRSAAERAAIQAECDAGGIAWHPLPYTRQPPVLSTLRDLRAMRRLAERLQHDRPFDLLHCRSYIAALVGRRLKRRHGTGFLFDMRGFWADERVDGGLWNLRNPLFRTIYRFFKAREADFLREADHVVSLTEAARDILLNRPDQAATETPISVIPCCADFAAFPPVTPDKRAAARAALGIASGARVAAYLGSTGTWYLLREMLDAFAVQQARSPGAVMLFVTRDDPQPIRAAAAARGIPTDSLIIRPATRAEVPELLAAADYGLFFIKPAFSKQASSPVKLGEFLAMELPVLTNAGIGDVDRILEESGAGVTIDRFDPAAYAEGLDRLERLRPDMIRWRHAARTWFDLDEGVRRYDAVYRDPSTSRNSAISRGACDPSE